MSVAFVPLVAGPVASPVPTTQARLKPISIEPTAFKLATPEASKPKTEAAPIQSPAAPALHVVHGPPKLTLERQGDRITHIRVECCCGQVTEIKCEY